ncbi:MAG TPA: hypothetical protein VF679_03770, partial [Pedobacter sp.]
ANGNNERYQTLGQALDPKAPATPTLGGSPRGILSIKLPQPVNAYNKKKSIREAPVEARIIVFLRGFVVYFWVDRPRRKFCYWEVSITFLFAVISFLIFCFYFCNPSLQWFLCKLKREVSKISFFILYLLFYYVLFLKGHIALQVRSSTLLFSFIKSLLFCVS